jgi:hypothetical protein
LAQRHAVTRWIAPEAGGTLEAIDLPPPPGWPPPLAQTRRWWGEPAGKAGRSGVPPLDNADRLGCVITCGTDRAATQALAESLVAATRCACARRARPHLIARPIVPPPASARHPGLHALGLEELLPSPCNMASVESTPASMQVAAATVTCTRRAADRHTRAGIENVAETRRHVPHSGARRRWW